MDVQVKLARSSTIVYGEKNARLMPSYTASVYDFRLAPFFSVYDRISAYTVTKIYDRNTGSFNTAK
jgi:hypothetical protein